MKLFNKNDVHKIDNAKRSYFSRHKNLFVIPAAMLALLGVTAAVGGVHNVHADNGNNPKDNTVEVPYPDGVANGTNGTTAPSTGGTSTAPGTGGTGGTVGGNSPAGNGDNDSSRDGANNNNNNGNDGGHGGQSNNNPQGSNNTPGFPIINNSDQGHGNGHNDDWGGLINMTPEPDLAGIKDKDMNAALSRQQTSAISEAAYETDRQAQMDNNSGTISINSVSASGTQNLQDMKDRNTISSLETSINDSNGLDHTASSVASSLASSADNMKNHMGSSRAMIASEAQNAIDYINGNPDLTSAARDSLVNKVENDEDAADASVASNEMAGMNDDVARNDNHTKALADEATTRPARTKHITSASKMASYVRPNVGLRSNVGFPLYAKKLYAKKVRRHVNRPVRRVRPQKRVHTVNNGIQEASLGLETTGVSNPVTGTSVNESQTAPVSNAASVNEPQTAPVSNVADVSSTTPTSTASGQKLPKTGERVDHNVMVLAFALMMLGFGAGGLDLKKRYYTRY